MRLWVGLGILAVGIVLATAFMEQREVAAFAGALIVLGILVAFVPWQRLRRETVPADGIWTKPGPGQRWCASCGRPSSAICVHCGETSRKLRQEEKRTRRDSRKAMRKSESRAK